MGTGTLKLISLFSGYDSPLLALDNINQDYDLIYWSEIDPYAILAHNIAHPAYQDRNIGDITTATPPSTKADILFYSSPCQDFSRAGHMIEVLINSIKTP